MVAVYSVAISCMNAMNTMLKVALTPNLAIVIKNGISERLSQNSISRRVPHSDKRNID